MLPFQKRSHLPNLVGGVSDKRHHISRENGLVPVRERCRPSGVCDVWHVVRDVFRACCVIGVHLMSAFVVRMAQLVHAPSWLLWSGDGCGRVVRSGLSSDSLCRTLRIGL